MPEEYKYLDEPPSRTPTPHGIDTILQPWRSDDNLRRKAYYISKDNVLVFLRTHYDPDDDDKMNEWVYETDFSSTTPGEHVSITCSYSISALTGNGCTKYARGCWSR
jgi:hypothetical protein